MKALVLAGGTGTRLRPLTHTSAKQLVPVGNRPVLFHGLDAVAAAGITATGVIVGSTEDQIRAAVGDGSAFGLHVTYLPQDEPLGLAHAVTVARDFLGDDDFVMYLGDNFLADGFGEAIDTFRADPVDAHLLLGKVNDPRRFGVATVTGDGRVVGLEEKPAAPRSDLALVGLYVFGPAVHDAIAAIRPSARGELEITDAVQRLVETGARVGSTVTTSYWRDTGTVPDLLDVNRHVLDGLRTRLEGTITSDCVITGPVVVEPGATVSATRIVGPAVVGAGATVHSSQIGCHTAIGARCSLTDSEVADSIVLEGSCLRGVRRIESSLIGRGAEIAPAPPENGAHQLVVGDHSSVHIA